jgi:AcrB/AcrD/AcrF family
LSLRIIVVVGDECVDTGLEVVDAAMDAAPDPAFRSTSANQRSTWLSQEALVGVAAETGVVMLIYLDQALRERRARCEREGRSFTHDDLHRAIIAGAVERVRPKMMAVAAIIAGLLPVLWASGTGAELMQRIAVPMIGGMGWCPRRS